MHLLLFQRKINVTKKSRVTLPGRLPNNNLAASLCALIREEILQLWWEFSGGVFRALWVPSEINCSYHSPISKFYLELRHRCCQAQTTHVKNAPGLKKSFCSTSTRVFFMLERVTAFNIRRWNRYSLKKKWDWQSLELFVSNFLFEKWILNVFPFFVFNNSPTIIMFFSYF